MALHTVSSSDGCPRVSRFHSIRSTRLSEAAACYTRALRADQTTPDQHLRCHLRLALCTIIAAERAKKARARTGGGGGQLTSISEQEQRDEAECLSALLLDEEGTLCSAKADDFVVEAHLTVGMFRLCEEWDVGAALDHFLVAASAKRPDGVSLQGGEEGHGDYQQVPLISDSGWGAVWLTQVGALAMSCG